MTNTFIIDSTEYTVTTCTAIAISAGDTESQNALLVTSIGDSGEKFEFVVFSYELPEDQADFAAMCEDSSAWSSDYEDIGTVALK